MVLQQLGQPSTDCGLLKDRLLQGAAIDSVVALAEKLRLGDQRGPNCHVKRTRLNPVVWHPPSVEVSVTTYIGLLLDKCTAPRLLVFAGKHIPRHHNFGSVDDAALVKEAIPLKQVQVVGVWVVAPGDLIAGIQWLQCLHSNRVVGEAHPGGRYVCGVVGHVKHWTDNMPSIAARVQGPGLHKQLCPQKPLSGGTETGLSKRRTFTFHFKQHRPRTVPRNAICKPSCHCTTFWPARHHGLGEMVRWNNIGQVDRPRIIRPVMQQNQQRQQQPTEGIMHWQAFREGMAVQIRRRHTHLEGDHEKRVPFRSLGGRAQHRIALVDCCNIDQGRL
mmetsp:Transcript_31823/g.87920  ORF Transcript_31823/g.87920 Transcript_31823/m.87920 type:complete len:331 (+) Transcript_31823:539-1531(+)